MSGVPSATGGSVSEVTWKVPPAYVLRVGTVVHAAQTKNASSRSVAPNPVAATTTHVHQ
jgi:hypothetical protein